MRLVPGNVDPRHFELLLSGTTIRTPALIEALRDHLVNGLTASSALIKHDVKMNQFWRRLEVIREEDKRAQELSSFYRKG
nr:PapB/FocB family fimbrial expression transcriptional regulator [Pseudomonas sp. GGS8]